MLIDVNSKIGIKKLIKMNFKIATFLKLANEKKGINNYWIN